MNTKIAINVFGELRLWKNNNFSELINFFNSKGFKVDVLGTFYNDEYTKKQDLSCFTKIQLIDRIEYNRDSLESYFYSLSKSYGQIRQYQIEKSTNYQFIVACRADITINLHSTINKNFDKLIENTTSLLGPWFNHQTLAYTDANRFDDPGNRWVNDQVFICNDKMLEIFSKYYLKNKDLNDIFLRRSTFRYDHDVIGDILQSNKIKIIYYKEGLRLESYLIRDQIIKSYNIPLSIKKKMTLDIRNIQEEEELHKYIVGKLKYYSYFIKKVI